MPNSNSNSNSKGSKPKEFTSIPPAGAVSPVGLRFSSNSNYENQSTIPFVGSNNGNGSTRLTDSTVPLSNNGVPNSPFNRGEEFGNANSHMGNGNSNNGNSNKGIAAYMTTNRISGYNQVPRATATNMAEYPTLGGRIFSNSKTPKKPGKRNNGKTGRRMRKNTKSRKTRKNRK